MPHEIKKKQKKEKEKGKEKENGAALKLRDALRCHMIFNRVTNEYIVRSDQTRLPPPFPLYSPLAEQRPLTTRAQTAGNAAAQA